MRFQREKAIAIADEILPLLFAHYEEVAHFQDIPFNPKFEDYFKLEELGLLRVFTMREGDLLIGYAIFVLQNHPHYKDSRFGVETLLYVDPDYRGHAQDLIRYADAALIQDGAEAICYTTTPRRDFGPVLERMGYEVMETTYTRRVLNA